MRSSFRQLFLCSLALAGWIAACPAHAQLGETRAALERKYGLPLSRDLIQAQDQYVWDKWRLIVDYEKDHAAGLKYIATTPVDPNEFTGILIANGGSSRWRPLQSNPETKLWRRDDGAAAVWRESDPSVVYVLSRDMFARFVPSPVTPTMPVPSVAPYPSPVFTRPASTPFPSVPRAPRTPIPYSSPATPTSDPFTFLDFGILITGGALAVGLSVITLLLTRNLRPRRVPLFAPMSPALVSQSPPVPAAPPPLRTLESLGWDEFELVVAELYRRQGYEVRVCAGDGGDGGFDIVLMREGKMTLVQCKHWTGDKKVPVQVVRELMGAQTAEVADACTVVTSGSFTRDAEELAHRHGIPLVNGAALREWIKNENARTGSEILDIASWINGFLGAATLTRPRCPFCQRKMSRRQSGQNPNNVFWGCPDFPGCNGKREVKRWLLSSTVTYQ